MNAINLIARRIDENHDRYQITTATYFDLHTLPNGQIGLTYHSPFTQHGSLYPNRQTAIRHIEAIVRDATEFNSRD